MLQGGDMEGDGRKRCFLHPIKFLPPPQEKKEKTFETLIERDDCFPKKKIKFRIVYCDRL